MILTYFRNYMYSFCIPTLTFYRIHKKVKTSSSTSASNSNLKYYSTFMCYFDCTDPDKK